MLDQFACTSNVGPAAFASAPTAHAGSGSRQSSYLRISPVKWTLVTSMDERPALRRRGAKAQVNRASHAAQRSVAGVGDRTLYQNVWRRARPARRDLVNRLSRAPWTDSGSAGSTLRRRPRADASSPGSTRAKSAPMARHGHSARRVEAVEHGLGGPLHGVRQDRCAGPAPAATRVGGAVVIFEPAPVLRGTPARSVRR